MRPQARRRKRRPGHAETRALWVLRTSLARRSTSPRSSRSAREHGFNTLLVQVRGRGDAYFISGSSRAPPDLQRQPTTFDPLATV